MLIWDLIPPWSVGYSSVFSYVSWRQVSLGSYRLLAPNFYMLKSPPFSWTVSKFYLFFPQPSWTLKLPRHQDIWSWEEQIISLWIVNNVLDIMLCTGINRKLGSPQSSCFSTILKTWFEMRLCPFVSCLNAQTPPSCSFTCLAWSQKTQLCTGVRAAKTQPCRFMSSLYTNLQVQETVGQLRASLNISCRTQDRCCKP